MNNNFHLFKKNYRVFNVFRSTGFLVPILYLYIEKNLSITAQDMLLISSIYILLPFIIEVPSGILADFIGNRRIIQIGIIFQIISCLALLLSLNSSGYHIYLIMIYTASL